MRPCPPHTPPVVGVTGPDSGGGAAWWFTFLAIELAGGHAVRITPRRPRPIDGLDALVIGGGADVDPELYGQQDLSAMIPAQRPPDEPRWLWVLEWLLLPLLGLARTLAGKLASARRDAARDRLETHLIDHAVARRLPVLGLCRGMQLLNVYFGGTLHQQAAGFYVEEPEVRTLRPRKRIAVASGTTLARVLGPAPRRVNALHRQAIDRLGTGLLIAATDRNGIVQAIEHSSLPFVVGVQWHPEYLPQFSEQRAVFRALVRAARNWSHDQALPPQR